MMHGDSVRWLKLGEGDKGWKADEVKEGSSVVGSGLACERIVRTPLVYRAPRSGPSLLGSSMGGKVTRIAKAEKCPGRNSAREQVATSRSIPAHHERPLIRAPRTLTDVTTVNDALIPFTSSPIYMLAASKLGRGAKGDEVRGSAVLRTNGLECGEGLPIVSWVNVVPSALHHADTAEARHFHGAEPLRPAGGALWRVQAFSRSIPTCSPSHAAAQALGDRASCSSTLQGSWLGRPAPHPAGRSCDRTDRSTDAGRKATKF
jgi:hypothetical protein